MKYKHLFFDLDHTLWDFDANAKITLTEIYSFFNLEYCGVQSFDAFYGHYMHHNQVLWSRYNKGYISGEELKWRRMWRTLLEFKIGDEKLAREMSEKYLEMLPVKKLLFPHTIEILDYLIAKDYELHMITNGFEKIQWMKLNNSGIGGYFRNVVTSETSNSLKPGKEIFDYAMHKAGANLSDSIMLGDNLDADIQGAINAGMDSVFVNHVNTTTDLKPTFTITHLKELEDIF